MRVVFMGTPDFAVGTLEAIIKAGHQVEAVVTQPDKPKGRGKNMQFPPVKEVALKYDIPVYQPVKVKEEAFQQVLEKINPEVIVVVAFGKYYHNLYFLFQNMDVSMYMLPFYQSIVAQHQSNGR